MAVVLDTTKEHDCDVAASISPSPSAQLDQYVDSPVTILQVNDPTIPAVLRGRHKSSSSSSSSSSSEDVGEGYDTDEDVEDDALRSDEESEVEKTAEEMENGDDLPGDQPDLTRNFDTIAPETGNITGNDGINFDDDNAPSNTYSDVELSEELDENDGLLDTSIGAEQANINANGSLSKLELDGGPEFEDENVSLEISKSIENDEIDDRSISDEHDAIVV